MPPFKLKGKNVLVTGGSRGLGETICVKFAEEGCNVAINYVKSKERAEELLVRIEKDYGIKGLVIQGDMALEEDCTRTVEEAIKGLGGLDILVSNAGYTRFIPFRDLYAPTPEDWDLTFAVNVKAQSYLLKAALPTLNGNPDGGVFLITSSIAGISLDGSSMPYAVSKAAQLHLMKCMAATQGPKIRVNAILPGLLLTEWGKRFEEAHVKDMEDKAWLKRVTDLEDCAQVFIDTAKNSSMTGQKIVVDSGLSNGAS